MPFFFFGEGWERTTNGGMGARTCVLLVGVCFLSARLFFFFWRDKSKRHVVLTLYLPFSCALDTLIMQQQQQRAASLILEDGSSFAGWSFGADVSVSGEAVFQTGNPRLEKSSFEAQAPPSPSCSKAWSGTPSRSPTPRTRARSSC